MIAKVRSRPCDGKIIINYQFHHAPLNLAACFLSRLTIHNMGKSKKNSGAHSHKFKELKGQFDNLGEEVQNIQSMFPYCVMGDVLWPLIIYHKEPMHQRNERENILMTPRMGAYPNREGQLGKVMASVITCRARWVSQIMSKYTCPSW
jgi:hypothetical protein